MPNSHGYRSFSRSVNIGSLPMRRRVFNIAEFVEVKGATFEDGLLKVDLVRNVPEAMKPRRIAINAAGNDKQTIEQKSAA